MTNLMAADAPVAAPSGEARSATQVKAGRNGAGPILVALHGRETSDAAALAAHLLADRMRTEVRIVTVIEPIPSVTGPDGMPLVVMVEPESWEARQDAVLRRLSLVPARGQKREIDVRYGQAAAEIARAAEEMRASVIVLDAAPHRRLRHTVSGRCATHVLRRSHIPVLSVSPGFSALPRRAVAAIDFSRASVEAARIAVRLLADNGTLTLVNVAPESEHFRMAASPTAESISINVNTALDRLCDELLALAPPGITIRSKVTSGVVITEILSIADQLEAELIAVGTHGPGIVERFFIGSVAGTILELAGTTVLACPAPQKVDLPDLEPKTSGTALSEVPETWRTWLDDFSKRNAGRPVTVEVDDPSIGAQVQARGYLLQGAACDPSDHSIEIMLGHMAGADAHLTRRIDEVASVAISTDVRGRDAALEIRHGEGRTLVMFKP